MLFKLFVRDFDFFLYLKEWKFIQALLGRSGKEGLKRMCTTLDATKMDLNLATVADKKYLSKHDLGSITDVSAGAATFFVWVSMAIFSNVLLPLAYLNSCSHFFNYNKTIF